MLCEHCHEHPAAVHITQVVNGQRVELNLCESCYQKEAGKFNLLVPPEFNLHNLLIGFFQPEQSESKPVSAIDGQVQCTNCGMAYADFGKVGQLGCSECYERFYTNLEPVLRRIHGNTAHVGKVPRRTGGLVRVRKEIAGLKARLQESISREAYEEAAKLRDEIRRREMDLDKE